MDVAELPGFQTALKDIRPVMAESVMWIVPDDEHHFDPVTVVVTIGGLLLTGFLAGFQEEASHQAKALGGKTAKWLAEQLKTVTAKVAHQLPADIADAARKASDRLRADKPDEAALTGSQEAIAAVLKDYMPPEQAQTVAAQLRTTVLSTMAGGKP